MAHLLHEVENPEIALKEAKRVTKSNIFIVEWPYKEQEMGPPLNHKISPDMMRELFLKCDLGECHTFFNNNMVLYFSR